MDKNQIQYFKERTFFDIGWHLLLSSLNQLFGLKKIKITIQRIFFEHFSSVKVEVKINS